MRLAFALAGALAERAVDHARATVCAARNAGPNTALRGRANRVR